MRERDDIVGRACSSLPMCFHASSGLGTDETISRETSLGSSKLEREPKNEGDSSHAGGEQPRYLNDQGKKR